MDTHLYLSCFAMIVASLNSLESEMFLVDIRKHIIVVIFQMDIMLTKVII